MGYQRVKFRFCLQQVHVHERSKNIYIFLYAWIFTLFAQRLPNDSLNDSFFQTPPLRDATLRWLVRLETTIFNAPTIIFIFIQTNAKIKFLRSARNNKWAAIC